jgi:DNA-binding NarL/FixJ family response regulator
VNDNETWGDYVATRILIADDSPVIRQCLGRLLGGHRGWEVCGEATDGEDAVCKAQELTPDVIVLDFLMPRKNGIEAAREIGKASPSTPILLCTISLTPELVNLARGAGIAGTLSKGELNRMVEYVEALLRGDTIPPESIN